MLALLLGALLATLLPSSLAVGEEFPDLSKRGSLTFEMVDAGGNQVPGGELTVYQVAGVAVDNGFRFAYTADFAGFSADSYVAEDADVASLAADYAGYALNTGATGTTVTIGSDGTAELADLDLGLYVVVQSKSASGYRSVSPFAVTIPYRETAESAYQYEVQTKPKCETVAKVDPLVTKAPRLRKTVTGAGAPANETFTFQLKRLSSANPMPTGAQGFVSQQGDAMTLRLSGAGTLDLGILTFEDEGIYAYELSEIVGTTPGFTYDTTVYRVEYTVVRQGDDLVVASYVVSDGTDMSTVAYEGVNPENYELEFVNPFEQTPPTTPKTPESKKSVRKLPKTSDLILPVGVLAAVGIALLAFGVVAKRKRDKS